MDAPKRIWAWPFNSGWHGGYYRDNKHAIPEPEKNGSDYILAAEHDRIVAEKDAEIARLHDKLFVALTVIETLRARLDTARNQALEDAARMVDCACECREAVLTANTRVERWTACGRDPCGALDAAAIRAMKGERG